MLFKVILTDNHSRRKMIVMNDLTGKCNYIGSLASAKMKRIDSDDQRGIMSWYLGNNTYLSHLAKPIESVPWRTLEEWQTLELLGQLPKASELLDQQAD